jgi:hypothetical protein
VQSARRLPAAEWAWPVAASGRGRPRLRTGARRRLRERTNCGAGVRTETSAFSRSQKQPLVCPGVPLLCQPVGASWGLLSSTPAQARRRRCSPATHGGLLPGGAGRSGRLAFPVRSRRVLSPLPCTWPGVSWGEAWELRLGRGGLPGLDLHSLGTTPPRPALSPVPRVLNTPGRP